LTATVPSVTSRTQVSPPLAPLVRDREGLKSGGVGHAGPDVAIVVVDVGVSTTGSIAHRVSSAGMSDGFKAVDPHIVTGQRGFGRRGLGDEACCAKSTALEQGPHLSGAIEVLYRLLGEYPPLARRSAAPGSVQKPPREHERSRLRPEELPGLERTGSPPSPRLHLRDFTQSHLSIRRKTNEGLTRFRNKVVGFRAPGNQATPPFFDREIPGG